MYSWYQKKFSKELYSSTEAKSLDIQKDDSICSLAYLVFPQEIFIVEGVLSYHQPIQTQSTSLGSADLDSTYPIIFESTETLMAEHDSDIIVTESQVCPTLSTSIALY